MKRHLFPMFVMATLSLGIGCRFSAAQDYRQPMHIPFDFMVKEQTLKAGDYTIQLISNSVLLIRDGSGRITTSVMTIPDLKAVAPEKSGLIFNRYGENYFLTRAFWAGYSTGRELPRSKREDMIASQRPAAPVTVVRK